MLYWRKKKNPIVSNLIFCFMGWVQDDLWGLPTFRWSVLMDVGYWPGGITGPGWVHGGFGGFGFWADVSTRLDSQDEA